ncbi:MAG: tetraacyldisaccharide 4'-kinase [Phycisphaerae bacterium]|jgi:tetraacyldisaccharide 4'-kinase|nr:tetraacyldisaccharide 4'-kinase [Phycisphaerae bacterium]
MKPATIRNAIAGRSDGLAARAGQAIARGVVWPYSLAMRLRRWAYNSGVFSSSRASVPVICVGNITTGGTGKTPMVAWVVRQLKEAGRKPAILTRGYKSVDGKSDEAEFLKQRSDVEVVVNPDRIAGAQIAADGGSDVLVMDDGFQHMRLKRDMNIVLIDAMNPFGYGCCLPLGRLREPLSALRDAHAVVITRSDAVVPELIEALEAQLARRAPQASMHLGVHKPIGLVDQDGKERPLSDIVGRKVLVFAGIGNPEAFITTVERLGAEPVDFCIFSDHQEYRPEIIQRIYEHAEASNPEILVTTEKDYIKLAEFELDRPVWRVVVEMDIASGRDELIEKLQNTAAAQTIALTK